LLSFFLVIEKNAGKLYKNITTATFFIIKNPAQLNIQQQEPPKSN